ncbi:MAG TPA: hypothetical protein VF450_10190 [Noviherbaspirillum sp.]
MANSGNPTSGNSNRFQWMIDVGVSPIEVNWLRRMDGSEKLQHPVAKRRVEEMHKQAYAALLASRFVVDRPFATNRA